MSQRIYIGGMIALALALVAVRLTLPPMGVRGSFYGHLETADIAVAATIALIILFSLLRLWNAGLSPLWVIPLFLWLAAFEALVRGAIEGEMSTADYIAVIESAPELALMLVLFLLFLALFRRVGPDGSRGMPVAGVTAVIATVMRPSLVVSGLDRLPWVGDWISLSGGQLTWLLRMERGVDVAKGLLIGQPWIGNAFLAAVFTVSLVAAVIGGRK
jgi:asparagine N-glycosylation enzyme membrane subunit Stt3